MEERKTAAIVLSILALVIIFFTVILPEIKFRGTQTLSFKVSQKLTPWHRYAKPIATWSSGIPAEKLC
ncbi:hypothetical protein MgSA37_00583 [Mucilaginibacter gotjawali]|uniref:Uncharacterized protein n=2 Tax=Mucilaginibacter gotjawali TaxID=1550579 RepID=A0A839SJU9_9SPHI|nr:hypothetical protein [Mucilaginibacter gotjawali]MBB3058611.1 hypothetical protein [Mucilaginibacter gotjawali]BAU52422.1 hypothetical protein MgSA37_00583 [Mucilaginibacter gotjawali]